MGARVLVVDDSPTIRKLVSAILSHHDYVPSMAPDGQAGLERLREGDIDLVLLDFVMPRMNGYQFCRELREDPKIAGVPVVLMSAKGDKIRGQFVQQTGAVDAITKPFDARGLVAVVESALQKAAEGRVRASDEIPIDVEMDDRPDSTPPGMEREAVAEFAQVFAQGLIPALEQVPPARIREPAELVGAIRRTMTPARIEALGPSARKLGLGAPAEPFGGDIEVVPLAEVLQILQLQRQTGTCRITNGRVEMTIYLREGLIDLAIGRGAREEFRLGRYLIEEGLVSRVELDALLKTRIPGSKKLLGELLMSSGLISENDLRRALIRQTSELVYEVLRWPKARFSFVQDLPNQPEVARLGLPVASIVMEGFRRVDEWRLIENSIHFDQVLVRDQLALDALGTDKLNRQEQLVLGAIDGHRSVREVLSAVDVSSFDACKILYQFLQSRLVRQRAA